LTIGIDIGVKRSPESPGLLPGPGCGTGCGAGELKNFPDDKSDSRESALRGGA
jgi:hypothetical protein